MTRIQNKRLTSSRAQILIVRTYNFAIFVGFILIFFSRKVYDNHVEDSDLWVVALAEDHVPGSLVGPTTHCLLKQQFQRLRDGDRFWYENPSTFTAKQLAEIKKTSLARVMCENLHGIVSVQKDVFMAATGNIRRIECSGISYMDLSLWKDVETTPEPTGAKI